MSAGTFAVSRRIWAHPEFAPSEFSEREAFLWLVSEASWKDRTARSGRVVIDLKRGQLCASIRFMAEAWMWSKSRVDRFLKRLENRDMLVCESGTGQLVITLCNYDEYQGARDTGGTRAGQTAGHERDTSGTNYKKDEIQSNTEKCSVSNDTGDYAADDPAKAVWKIGVTALSAHGVTEAKARQMIGKWRKDNPGKDAEILTAILDCEREGVVDPIPWIQARLAPKKTVQYFDFSKYGVPPR